MADRTLTIRVVGDSKSGEQALANVAHAADKTTTSSKTTGDALASVRDRLLSVVPGGQQAAGVIGKMGSASGETGSLLKGALVGGMAATGVAIAGLVEQGVTKFASLTNEVLKFQRASGASAEEASKFVAVAKGYGTDVDVLSGAVFKMGANIATTPQKFTDLGIAIAHNKDGTVDLIGTLENASAAYNATADATQKDAIAKALGGKVGAQLIPILEGGSKAIKEFGDAAAKRGEVFNQGDIESGKQMRESFHDLGQAATGLEISLSKDLVPAITSVTKTLSAGIDLVNKYKNDLAGAFVGTHQAALNNLSGKEFDVYFSHLKHGKEAAQKALDEYRSKLGDVSKTQDAGKVSQDDLNAATAAGVEVTDKMSSADVESATSNKQLSDSTAQLNSEIQKKTDALGKALDAQNAAINSDLAFRQAEQSLTDANQALTDKQVALNVAVRDHGAASAEAKAATADLAKAQQDAVGAVVADAQAFVQLQTDQAAATGTTLDASQKHQLLLQRLSDLANALGPGSPLRAQLQGYINQLESVPATVHTQVLTSFVGTNVAGGGQPVRQFAGGGRTPGGPVIVGEQGPELVDLPAGSTVHTASETAGMGQGGHTFIQHNTINMPPGSDGGDVVRAIKEYEQRNGTGWRAN